jgi:hypothetical protein
MRICGAQGCLVVAYLLVDDAEASMVSGAIIPATPTHGFCSLVLSVAHRVVPYGRSVHSNLAR